MKIQKIDLTLGISFGLLIAILAGVSWLGLAEMARVNNNLEELATRRWAKVELARQALEFSNLNNRITLEIFLLRDRAEIDPLLKRRAENSGKITVLLNQIKGLSQSEKETALIQSIWEFRTPYVQSYQKALNLLLEDKNLEAARTAMVSEVLPNLITYHNAWDDFVDFQGDQLDQAARESRNSYRSSRMVMLSLVFVAAALAFAVAIFVIGREHRKNAAQLLANRERDQLLHELEQRTKQTGLLAELSDLLQGCISLEESCANIAKFTQALFPESAGTLLLLSPSRNLLEVASSWKTTPRETVFDVSSCWAVRTGHPHFFAADSPSPSCSHVSQSGCSYACLPLMAQAEELGVLNISLPQGKQFTKPDLQLANSLAKQASLSLANLK
ncbi:MAG: MCP four helix bundle domain-containing protein, partial [Acidobacteriota bacterium]|nr:MCP four helix bundle domain-containing protein [Acidobacteriota bacterium]